MVSTPNRPKRRFLAWLPAVLLIGAGIVTSLGISLVPSATATTNSDPVDIQATVLAEVHVTACADITEPALAINQASTTQLGTDCVVSFGSNNATTLATLVVKDANADGMFFCERVSAAVACSGDGTMANTAANQATLADGTFGARRSVAASNCTASGWVGAGASNYYPILAAGTTICTDTASGSPDGSVTVQFATNTTAAQAPGTYYGRVTFEATAS